MEKSFTKRLYLNILPKLSLKMKLTILLIFFSLFKIQAESYSQNTKITLNLQSVKIITVLETIESLSEFKFLTNEKLIDQTRLVSINVKNKRIYKILDELFENQDITYNVVDRQIILAKDDLKNQAVKRLIPPKNEQQNQEKEIKGTVKDEEGNPLPGVTVLILGTTNGVATDFNGEYSIKVSVGEALQFSFLGLKTKIVTVAESDTIDVVLEEDTDTLNEIVVTALGIRKEAKKLGYSLQTVKGEDLSKVRSANIANTLSGRVTGVQINQNGSGIGGSASVTVRGITSLVPGQNSALIVVDGVILDGGGLGQGSFSGGLDYGNALSDINPDDVQSVNVLKGGECYSTLWL